MSFHSITNILREYDQKQELLFDFTQKMEVLVRELLYAYNISVHSVTSRLKKRDSLEEKIIEHKLDYSELCEITDISGVRVITYFSDEVYLIANIIEKEFEIIPIHSQDKLALLDPDRFGYLSLHYVVKLNDERKNQTEYNRFCDCLFEIQIRSILRARAIDMFVRL